MKNNIWFYKKECCTRENRAAFFLSEGMVFFPAGGNRNTAQKWMVEKAFNGIYT